MSFNIARNIDRVRSVGYDYGDIDQFLSPAELEQLRRECEDAPTDDDEPFYAYAVWDAVNKRWVDA